MRWSIGRNPIPKRPPPLPEVEGGYTEDAVKLDYTLLPCPYCSLDALEPPSARHLPDLICKHCGELRPATPDTMGEDGYPVLLLAKGTAVALGIFALGAALLFALPILFTRGCSQ